jgi:hypothetical protein
MRHPYTFGKSFLALFALINIFVTQANLTGFNNIDEVDFRNDDELICTYGVSGANLMLTK